MNLFKRLKYIWNIPEGDILLEKKIKEFCNEMDSSREKQLHHFEVLLKGIHDSIEKKK